MTQQPLQKKALSKSTSTPSSSEFLQTRPFAETNNTVTQEQQAPPDLQAQVDRASRFGHSFGKLAIQPKLTIGQPGDKYEQEADAVAAQVVQRINAPTSLSAAQGQAVQRETAEEELQMKPLADSIQRQELPEEEELQMKPLLQRRSDQGGTSATPDLEASIEQARGGGQTLSKDIRMSMEQAFGADFGGVKIHTDAQSDMLNRSIQARAFTTGQDIFFRQGAYKPGSQDGQELLAHELTHVVQQNKSAVQLQSQHNGIIQRNLFSSKKSNYKQQDDSVTDEVEKVVDKSRQARANAQAVDHTAKLKAALSIVSVFQEPLRGELEKILSGHNTRNYSHYLLKVEKLETELVKNFGLEKPKETKERVNNLNSNVDKLNHSAEKNQTEDFNKAIKDAIKKIEKYIKKIASKNVEKLWSQVNPRTDKVYKILETGQKVIGYLSKAVTYAVGHPEIGALIASASEGIVSASKSVTKYIQVYKEKKNSDHFQEYQPLIISGKGSSELEQAVSYAEIALNSAIFVAEKLLNIELPQSWSIKIEGIEVNVGIEQALETLKSLSAKIDEVKNEKNQQMGGVNPDEVIPQLEDLLY